MTVSLLLVGLLLGLKHALEADHVAAVASLATRNASWRETIRVSAAWGLGHAGTLFVFGAVLVLLGANLPDSVASALEAAVGVMLVVLGVDVLRRIRARRIHFHAHSHGAGKPHVHLHSHEFGHAHDHPHPHPHRSSIRALIIGCVHGLAGTAGLVLLAVPTLSSGTQALVYLAVFGAGTIVGMIGFSLVIAVPLTFTARRLRRVTLGIEALLGAANVSLGLWIAIESISAILAN
jgi:cytochrome c biogenesis protein CcdA